MRVALGHKFILGVLVVVGSAAFVPGIVERLGYPPELTSVLSYVIAMTLGLILGSIFSRSFTRNITRLTTSAESISKGDLSFEVRLPDSRFPDETKDMAVSINLMVKSLRELVGHIRATSENVSLSARTLSGSAAEINVSAEEVAQSIEQISKGAETQAIMIEKSSKLIREMAISVELVANRAREAAKTAKATSVTAKGGGEFARNSLQNLAVFFDSVEASSRQFLELNMKLQQVGKIADVIAEIARQTNLLALNASIEAARAGEYGKGFAIVADEVRKLADGTSRSASEIVDLISAVKEESRGVHDAIIESSRYIKEGKQNISATASSFEEIIRTVVETERKANTIADLSRMQNEGADKMVQAVDEIARVAEDNAASTEEVAAASEEQSAAMQEMAHAAQALARLADDLLQVVERFRLEGTAHGTP